jgi:hypothetical protein
MSIADVALQHAARVLAATTAPGRVPPKMLGGRTANAFGLQIGRILAARIGRRLRRRPRTDFPADLAALERDGVCVLRDFLPVDAFRAVRGEYVRAFDQRSRYPYFPIPSGTTLLEEISLDPQLIAKEFPALWQHLCCNARLLALVRSATRRPIHVAPVLKPQSVRPIPSAEIDTENLLHEDYYRYMLKAWLFLDDVDEKNAPFVYVPGSHRVSLAKLLHEYTASLVLNGSPRVPDTIRQLMEVQERPILAPANTLVVACTSGFHRRSEWAGQGQRRAIHIDFRYLESWYNVLDVPRWLQAARRAREAQ